MVASFEAETAFLTELDAAFKTGFADGFGDVYGREASATAAAAEIADAVSAVDAGAGADSGADEAGETPTAEREDAAEKVVVRDVVERDDVVVVAGRGDGRGVVVVVGTAGAEESDAERDGAERDDAGRDDAG